MRLYRNPGCFVLLILIFAGPCESVFAGKPIFEVRGLDNVSYYCRGFQIFRVSLNFWDEGWKFRHPENVSYYYDESKNRIEYSGHFRTRGKKRLEQNIPFTLDLTKKEQGKVSLHLEMDSPGSFKIEGAALTLYLPEMFWAGRDIGFVNNSGSKSDFKIPFYPFRQNSHNESIKQLILEEDKKSILRLVFDRAFPVTIVDQRIRSGKDLLSMRILLADGEIESGRSTLSLTFNLDPDTLISLDPDADGKINQTNKWIVNPLPWDTFPVDLSFLNHKPAGSKGFVKVQGDGFVFENGEEVRFWGVNLSANQCFPEKEEAEKLARRLSRMGVNLARMHHLHVKWAKRQLFHIDGKGVAHFDPMAWLKLDYLLYCLKKQGIYIQLDMLVDPDHIWPKPPNVETWKGFSHFVPKLIKWQKQYIRAFWEHRSPHTGLAYKDDPAIALSTITNENDITTHNQIYRKGRYDVEPYITHFENIFDQWNKRNNFTPFINRKQRRREFNSELQASYFEEIRSYMRQIGVKIPVTGTNWCVYQKDLPSMAVMDYLDTHVYASGRLDSSAELGSVASGAAFARISGKPFVVSEYGIKWPEAWRITLPVRMASAGSLQDWNGLILYAYRQNGSGEISEFKGPYNLLIDPMMMGIMPVSALIFRRGDVRAARKCLGIHWSPEMLYGKKKYCAGFVPFYNTCVETHKLVAGIESPPGEAQAIFLPDKRFSRGGMATVQSDTGELLRDMDNRMLTINSGRTKGAIGDFRKQKEILLGPVLFKIESDLAAVFLSSLDMLPLEKSQRILITSVGRAENSGTVWNLGGDQLLAEGQAPVLTKSVEGEIVLDRHDAGHFRLFALKGDGKSVPKEMAAKDGQVSIELSSADQALFYLLVKQESEECPFCE